MLTKSLAEHRWSIIIGLLVVVSMSVAAWVFAPKGENQTYVFHHPHNSITLRDTS
jgi:hypothetical protein